MAAEQLPEHMDFQPFALMHHMAQAIIMAPASQHCKLIGPLLLAPIKVFMQLSLELLFFLKNYSTEIVEIQEPKG